MDLQLLPAPIAYVRHLVNVEDDDRAKFDQLRVLAQNMLQLLAAILVNDCLRLKLDDQMATPPIPKRLAVGEFTTFIAEAADALMSQIERSYVPELVHLYGENSKKTRQRSTRLQRIVQNRNRDAHTASLAQTRELLNELNSDVDDVLEELDFLRTYTMVAAKSVELTPDRRSSQLNGVRCHGVSDKYIPIQLRIDRMVSRSEVILVKVDRSDWLTLRPWFLYLGSDGSVDSVTEELTLLNGVNDRRLDYVGLVSGADYRPDNGWRTFTVYELTTAQSQLTYGATHDVIEAKATDKEDTFTEQDMRIDTWDPSRVSTEIKHLARSYENIVVQIGSRSRGTDSLVSVRTPTREVAVAAVDTAGVVWLYLGTLKRAVVDGLISTTQLNEALRQLSPADIEEIFIGTALLDIGHISDRIEWLGSLARRFSS